MPEVKHNNLTAGLSINMSEFIPKYKRALSKCKEWRLFKTQIELPFRHTFTYIIIKWVILLIILLVLIIWLIKYYLRYKKNK